MAASLPCLASCSASLAGAGSFCASILHPGLVIWLAGRLLPMRAQELDRLDRIEPGIIHPVMRTAEVGDVVRIVIAGMMVQMRDHQRRRQLQSTDDATPKGVILSSDLSCLSLLANEQTRGIGLQKSMLLFLRTFDAELRQE